MIAASKFDRLVMLDFEFTSLDPDASLIWDIGVVVVEFPSMALITAYSDQCGVPEHQWCRRTLEWARKTYDEDTYRVATTPKPGDRFQARRKFISGLMAFLQEHAAGPDVIVMTNHPEMDLQVLRKNILCSFWNADQARTSNDLFPWQYRNVQDLQSVILGLLSYDDKEFEDCGNTGKSATHRAIDDCYNQIQWLKRAMRRNSISAARANKWHMAHAMTPNYIEYPDTDFDSEKERMPQIATNGNEGEHYGQVPDKICNQQIATCELAAPAVQEEPDISAPAEALTSDLSARINKVSKRSLDGNVVMSSEEWNGIIEQVKNLLTATPQPAEQKAAPDVAGEARAALAAYRKGVEK